MSYASYDEDIQELRAEYEHFSGSVDRLIEGLRQPRSAEDLAKAEHDLQVLSERLIRLFDDKKARAEELLEEAIRLLQRPESTIAKQVNKRTSERDHARKERDSARNELELSRESQTKALRRAADFESENRELLERVAQLESRTQFAGAMTDVRPLKRK